MPLQLGTLIGPYELVASVGAGGMGQVYKAFDRTLNRQVAIKVLPELFATDPDRLARFEREAQILATLNHNLIAQVYGFEKTGNSRALVMEFVDGQTLEERLVHGPLPVREALQIARQIGEALEAAHEAGIVHRDLKPANVKIRSDDTVKVLDFGLAKALEPAGASLSPDVMNSPTLTARATQLGVVLGTAAYMSPEQAKGKPVDRRADVWAFGVLLYEMLTGWRPFQGEDISELMAAVLREPVDFSALPPDTAPAVRQLIERCLERDVKQRLRDIGEARVLLDQVLSGKSSGAALMVRAPVPAWQRVLPWALLVVITGIGAAAVFALWPKPPGPPEPTTKLLSRIGVDSMLLIEAGPAAVISPDGRTMVFRGSKDDQAQLFVRPLDQLQVFPLAGTDRGNGQFFSPDGRWIGFFSAGKLRKVALSGGAAVEICDAPVGRGAVWMPDDHIIFQSSLLPKSPLLRVPASGGKPQPVTILEDGETVHRWPSALPDGKGLLYIGHSLVTGYDTATIRVQTKAGGPGKLLLRGGYFPQYVASGHLLYVHQGSLHAVKFDLDRMEIVGQPVRIIEGVSASTSTGGAQVSVSETGTLVFIPGPTTAGDTRVRWMTPDGKTSVLVSVPADWNSPMFSPDGRYLALSVIDGKHFQIVVHDMQQNSLRQLTFDASNHVMPVWSPDSRRLVYGSDAAQPGIQNLYWQRMDGVGGAQRLTTSAVSQVPYSIHPKGRFLAYNEISEKNLLDIRILPLNDDREKGWTAGTSTLFVSTPGTDSAPAFSPDGRWLAYASNEEGTFSIYVRDFPGGTSKWRIGDQGGSHPRWSRTSQELFFSSADQILVAPYKVNGNSLQADRARLWSPLRYAARGPIRTYDVHPDGKRVVAHTPEQTIGSPDSVVFAFNFFEELRRRVP